jgi:HEAT repeat protein
MAKVLEIEGMDELLQALRDAPDDAVPFVREAMLQALGLIEGPVKLYPAATAANSSANERWYQRGFGPKWRTKAGVVHGRRTSERLGSHWVSKSTVYRNGVQVLGITGPVVEGIVGNNVSYVMAVQSQEKQARWHRARGWPVLETVMDDVEDDVYRVFETAVDRWVDRFNQGR